MNYLGINTPYLKLKKRRVVVNYRTRIRYPIPRPASIIIPVRIIFSMTENSIKRPASGFLPTASTPLVATLPKYINPSTNEIITTIAAARYLRASKGDRNAALPADFIDESRLVRMLGFELSK